MPGTGFPSGPAIETVSPIANMSGCPGTLRSGRTCNRPARSAAAPSHSAADEARTPAAQIKVLACRRVAAIHDAVGRAFGDGLSQYHFDADAFERALRIGREIVGKAREYAGAGLDQNDTGLVGVDVAEVGRQRVLRELGDGAREFDAGRAGADNHEGQQRRASQRIGLALGAFEGDQDAAPQRGGVLECFQAGRERLPFVMAEIGVTRAGGENQRVIGQRVAVIEQHALALPRRRRSRWRTAS